ncbi:MAG TPA: hypothetical protein VMT66_00495 [Steroidobacteraceae bacterium]|nr:hypothetical protein [Steroidobacteraceae bacterium]
MPRYEITVQGRGIVLPSDAAFAVGFLRIVQVRAKDPVDAEARAVALVMAEWCATDHATANRGGAPSLTILRTGLLSVWQRLLGAPADFIFFAEDGVVVRPAGAG